jgi:hypothetical protein
MQNKVHIMQIQTHTVIKIRTLQEKTIIPMHLRILIVYKVIQGHVISLSSKLHCTYTRSLHLFPFNPHLKPLYLYCSPESLSKSVQFTGKRR